MNNFFRFLILLSFLFLNLNVASFADDSVYFSYGGNLYPTENSEIELTYEKLDFEKTRSDFFEYHNVAGVKVSAYLEFNNNSDEKALLIGFESPAYEYEFETDKGLDSEPKSGIKDFKILFNDVPTPCKMSFLKDKNRSDIVVYTFKAKIKKGFNKILHTYTIFGRHRNAPYVFYSYKLSTGNRWANKQIDKIDININLGPHSFFSLPTSIENSKREIKWLINGEGSQQKLFYDISWDEWGKCNLDGINYFSVNKGAVSTTITSLRADNDFKIIDFENNRKANEIKNNFSNYDICNNLHRQALEYYRQKNDIKAVELYKEAIKYAQYPQLYYDYGNSLSNLNDHLKDAIGAYKACLNLDEFYYLADYNLACAYSRMGMISDAYEELRTALIYGYRNLDYIEKDPDLINLRADPFWESKWGGMKLEIRK
jgi:hypothetical protein